MDSTYGYQLTCQIYSRGKEVRESSGVLAVELPLPATREEDGLICTTMGQGQGPVGHLSPACLPLPACTLLSGNHGAALPRHDLA